MIMRLMYNMTKEKSFKHIGVCRCRRIPQGRAANKNGRAQTVRPIYRDKKGSLDQRIILTSILFPPVHLYLGFFLRSYTHLS